MFCKYCGKQNDDDASFCQKCGKPQRPGVVGPDKSVITELCEIKWDYHKGVGVFSSKVYFFAQAIGPKGQYTVSQSPLLKMDGSDSYPPSYSKAANEALKDLIGRLVRDGWEPIGRTDMWYGERFHR